MNESAGPGGIAARFQAAWNTHDMDAFDRLFHADATFVNRFGAYWRGAGQIIAGHTHIHTTVYRDSTLAVETPDIDPISDDAVILHFWTRLSAGAAHPAGPHQVDTLMLVVATRRDGEWRIQAAENVTLADAMTGATRLRP